MKLSIYSILFFNFKQLLSFDNQKLKIIVIIAYYQNISGKLTLFTNIFTGAMFLWVKGDEKFVCFVECVDL